MKGADWDAFHTRRAILQPPLRPDAEVVAGLAELIAGHDENVLLLGATPELTGIGERTVAVDWCALAAARMRDAGSRGIICADWRQMPLAPGSMSAAIGDGSLASMAWSDVGLVLDAVAGALASGAPVAIRCYLTPAVPEDRATIAEDRERIAREGFHALKWRIAMACAGETGPDVPVTAILAAFDAIFPDRAVLAGWTGWSAATIGEIDAYRASHVHLSFPNADALLAHVPDRFEDARFVAAGAYPLADRCPILAMRRR